MELRREYEELKEKIDYHSHLYYDLDAPELDDFEFDALTRRVERDRGTAPGIRHRDSSPTQHVGGAASGRFEKVTHAVKMESLQDVFSLDEVREFDAASAGGRILRRSMWWRPNIDGLLHQPGIPRMVCLFGAPRGATALWGKTSRGTSPTIQDIPEALARRSAGISGGAREKYICPAMRLCSLVRGAGGSATRQPFKNPRNAAAGSLRQKDSSRHCRPWAVRICVQSAAVFAGMTHAPATRTAWTTWPRWGFRYLRGMPALLITSMTCIREIEAIGSAARHAAV